MHISFCTLCPLLYYCMLAVDWRLLCMKDLGNTSLYMSYVLDRCRCCFSHWLYLHKALIPISRPSLLRIQSMFNLFLLLLFLNGVQLAFIALPFQSRVGANLFSVDIKGQFTLLFRKYFPIFFLNSCNIIRLAIRWQTGKHCNVIAVVTVCDLAQLRNNLSQYGIELFATQAAWMAMSVSGSTTLEWTEISPQLLEGSQWN